MVPFAACESGNSIRPGRVIPLGAPRFATKREAHGPSIANTNATPMAMTTTQPSNRIHSVFIGVPRTGAR